MRRSASGPFAAASVCGLALQLSSCSAPGHTASPPAGRVATPAGGGAILQADEGERRVRRRPPGQLASLTAPLVMKVDPQTTGATDLVVFYEDIPPGQAISPHHHSHAEEILFVHRGSGVAELGAQTRAVATGATIFIPRDVRVSLRNTGTEPLGVVSVFSRPGFEEYLRAVSVPEGQAAAPLSVAELTAIRARYRQHVVYERP